MAFGNKADRIRDVEYDNVQLRTENEQLRQLHEAAEGVAALAIGEIQSLTESGQLTDQATPIAVAAIVATERKRLADELAAEIQATEYEQHATAYYRKNGNELRAGIHASLEEDGTLHGIRRNAETDTEKRLRVEVEAEEAAAINARLEDPDVISDMKARLLEELINSDRGSELKEEALERQRAEWDAELVSELNHVNEAEVLDGEAAHKAERRIELAESRAVTDHRDSVAKQHKERWDAAVLEELLEAAFDEEERDAIKARITQISNEVKKTEENNRAGELLREFETLGIDMDNIPAGKKVTIVLGKTKMFDLTRKVKNENYRYQHDPKFIEQKYREKGIVKTREILLTSHGEGKFSVDDDTLNGSSNPHESAASLAKGTIIVLGRNLTENGEERFEHRVAAGHNLIYDDNTTTEDVVDSLETVANVYIDEFKARPITHVVSD